MKRFALALLVLGWASAADAAWTFVNSGGNGSSASGTTLTFTIATVHAGDVVVIGAKWEGVDTTISCSDTASTYTDAFVGAHVTDAGGGSHTICYTLSSSTSGTVTYTVTWGAATTFRDIGGMAYTPPSAAALDGTGHLAIGNSASVNSGNMTTTSTDGVAFGTYGETGGVPTDTTAQINGVAKDQILSYGVSTQSRMWSKAYSAGFTGAATLTITANPWGSGVIAFKPSGGGGATLHNLLLLGVGL